MIQDQAIVQAVPKILQRSERQEDIQKIIDSYVDVGILTQLTNRNHQILYGRRGTGKTHVLKRLQVSFEKDAKTVVVYLDARTLGSSTQYSDPAIDMRIRCTALFRDILLGVYHDLLNHIVEKAGSAAQMALEDLNDFEKAIYGGDTKVLEQTVIREAKRTQSSEAGVFVTLDGLRPKVEASTSIGASTDASGRVESKVLREEKIFFPEISAALKKLLHRLDATLVILLDEWSGLLMDIQPFLAEFIRRALLPASSVVVKIAALEYRSKFFVQVDSKTIGFELGADISATLDIDDYFVYDRNKDQVVKWFSEILLRHLVNELPESYLHKNYKIRTGEELATRLFTTSDVFGELVRASEGVARDLINIFTAAYFDSHKKGNDKIEKRSVIEAAQQWYEKDKLRNLDDRLHRVLARITSEVIGTKRARSFMVSRELEKHSVILGLFDQRVLHLMHRGYADKDNPGTRYSIFTLDYGTYVALMNTTKAPEIGFGVEGPGKDFVVPYDDKRSIRRIILDASLLEEAT